MNKEEFINKWSKELSMLSDEETEFKKDLDSLLAQLMNESRLIYECNNDCPDVEYGNCYHPSNCVKKLKLAQQQPELTEQEVSKCKFYEWCDSLYHYKGVDHWTHGSGGNEKHYTTVSLFEIYKNQGN